MVGNPAKTPSEQAKKLASPVPSEAVHDKLPSNSAKVVLTTFEIPTSRVARSASVAPNGFPIASPMPRRNRRPFPNVKAVALLHRCSRTM
jgi:hypothetical protein